ncbi:MAG: hypothetical protein J1F01_00780 [Oscillospiraceae bacterium]|nr:hypothetical protein [Oscillospiraceae bacterium]
MINKNLIERWKILCQIHILTKHYSLLAEEFGFLMKAILQPIKEQRDAYEHIIRAYTKLLEEGKRGSEYASTSLDKAIGHEYRAFFDSIDYLTIVIREKIHDELSKYEYNDIKQVYPNYDTLKKDLNTIPVEIAQNRENKDIGNSDMLEYAYRYGRVMEKLLDDYAIVSNKIVPKLNEKKGTSGSDDNQTII